MVEDRGRAALIGCAVPLAEAVPYGDMLTIETGHSDHWAAIARRGGSGLRSAGIPSAPLWSEYDEWPRGRVLFVTAIVAKSTYGIGTAAPPAAAAAYPRIRG